MTQMGTLVLWGPTGATYGDGAGFSSAAGSPMIAFLVSVVITAVMFGIVIGIARRRPPGTPFTWGEAFIAALFTFALLLMVYGVVPDRWLRWADGDLKWRSDKIGIPLGGLGIGH